MYVVSYHNPLFFVQGTVHLYSSQTFNSTVVGKEALRKQLDPSSRYTHSQLYHSRTIEPPAEVQLCDRKGEHTQRCEHNKVCTSMFDISFE